MLRTCPCTTQNCHLQGWASIPPGGLERFDVPMPHGHQGSERLREGCRRKPPRSTTMHQPARSSKSKCGCRGGLSGAKLSHCVLSETSSSFLDRRRLAKRPEREVDSFNRTKAVTRTASTCWQPEVTASSGEAGDVVRECQPQMNSLRDPCACRGSYRGSCEMIEAVWMSLKYAFWLFFSTSPDDPAPYVFIRLQDSDFTGLCKPAAEWVTLRRTRFCAKQSARQEPGPGWQERVCSCRQGYERDLQKLQLDNTKTMARSLQF